MRFGNEIVDGYGMCFEVKFFYETLNTFSYFTSSDACHSRLWSANTHQLIVLQTSTSYGDWSL